MAAPKVHAAYNMSIGNAKDQIRAILKSKNCHQLFLKLAFRDAGSFDSTANTFGANGSIRTKKELSHKGNEGLDRAVELLSAVKAKEPTLSFADIYQLAGILAVEDAGGPEVPFTPGRKDSWAFPPEGYYVSPNTSDKPAEHFKEWAKRTGLSVQAASALLGAHIIGRWWPGQEIIEDLAQPPLFSNAYFKRLVAGEIPEDSWVRDDTELQAYAQAYALDEVSFLENYADAHELLSLLGTKLTPSTQSVSASDASSVSSYYAYCKELAADPQVQAVSAAVAVAASAIIAVVVWRRRRRRLLGA